MKQQTRTQVFIIMILSFSCVGLVVESIMQRWEYWVPPLLVIGMIAIWIIHIIQYGTLEQRENLNLLYAMLAMFFHGVHESSIFDLSVVSMLMFCIFSSVNRLEFLEILFLEYIILLGIQLFMMFGVWQFSMNRLDVSRLILHNVAELATFLTCRNNIQYRSEQKRILIKREQKIENMNRDVDDFLSNVSHELRTPVNVVNGLSELLLKREKDKDIESIRDAGIRLYRQIEDIQDYTELQRGDLALEEEDYQMTSLINDVLFSFHLQDNKRDLEFIVDLDPDVPAVMHGDVRKFHKIICHLMENAVKYTKQGGLYIRISTEKREYGVNLEMEIRDTGIGMKRKDLADASKGFYQANKKKNRSTGGIGLGLSIVYGFIRKMGGFVNMESVRGRGTTVRISVPQEVVDGQSCLHIDTDLAKDIIFHVKMEKYAVPEVREFYSSMAEHLAAGLKRNLYSATSIREIENLYEELDVSHIFMGAEEYEENRLFFEELAQMGVVIAVSVPPGYRTTEESRAIMMEKPLYGYQITQILNYGIDGGEKQKEEAAGRLDLSGIRALIVDDEPMNLVVATGLFQDYGFITETADSGKEAIQKYSENEYDIIFMDHMMPEMDGVEAMKEIRKLAKAERKDAVIVALTANALSGAREMFLSEGFDGFISKPISISTFERVMKRVFPQAAGGE